MVKQLFALLLVLVSLSCTIPGRIANDTLKNARIKTTFFSPGQPRDGIPTSSCNFAPNMGLYTVVPQNEINLQWKVNESRRDYVLQEMKAAGLNTITMSYWGEPFISCETWSATAPMQITPRAQDELFAAAAKNGMMVMPLLEGREPDCPNCQPWIFRGEFPRRPDGQIAPGAVSQITDLVNRYIKNNNHPEWEKQWLKVFDRQSNGRYAVGIIHVSSDLEGVTDAEFAAGFDLLADQVFRKTGIRVGFFLDLLPTGTNAPGRFKATPEITGPYLKNTFSVLGIQCFIPEVWHGDSNEDVMIRWKDDFSRRWEQTGIPFLMDISPGYDAREVFHGSKRYGFNQGWRDALKGMVHRYGNDGIAYNSWNGYTEGMVGMPFKRVFDDTACCGDQFWIWLRDIDK